MCQVSKPAPTFSETAVVPGKYGPEMKGITLDDMIKDDHYALLLFYPLDFTFVCPTEIHAFGDAAERFAKYNCNVAVVSTDSEFTHLAWMQTPRRQGGVEGIKVPMIADTAHRMSKDYGVLLEDQGIALRGAFIIDGKGVLRSAMINDLPVGRSVDEALRLVAAFRFTDEHGEVCPATWHEGDEGMKADPVGKLEHFEKL